MLDTPATKITHRVYTGLAIPGREAIRRTGGGLIQLHAQQLRKHPLLPSKTFATSDLANRNVSIYMIFWEELGLQAKVPSRV